MQNKGSEKSCPEESHPTLNKHFSNTWHWSVTLKDPLKENLLEKPKRLPHLERVRPRNETLYRGAKSYK